MAQKLFIVKLEPDLNPKPETLCEHGPDASKSGTRPTCIMACTPISSVIIDLNVTGGKREKSTLVRM